MLRTGTSAMGMGGGRVMNLSLRMNLSTDTADHDQRFPYWIALRGLPYLRFACRRTVEFLDMYRQSLQGENHFLMGENHPSFSGNSIACLVPRFST